MQPTCSIQHGPATTAPHSSAPNPSPCWRQRPLTRGGTKRARLVRAVALHDHQAQPRRGTAAAGLQPARRPGSQEGRAEQGDLRDGCLCTAGQSRVQHGANRLQVRVPQQRLAVLAAAGKGQLQSSRAEAARGWGGW